MERLIDRPGTGPMSVGARQEFVGEHRSSESMRLGGCNVHCKGLGVILMLS